ncbi:MAG: hypothetical protein H0W27_03220 [Actinobacteria bacterium]|nr:hypothetical protein [Actinomycetota bacterium]
MAQALPARCSVRNALLAVALVGALPAAFSVPAGAATTFTVNQTGDAADQDITDNRCDTSPAAGRQCTLRAAIEEANDTPGADAITFSISSPTSVKTISPASPLPAITDPVTIDGYTQPGASPNTLATGNDAVLKIQPTGPTPELVRTGSASRPPTASSRDW